MNEAHPFRRRLAIAVAAGILLSGTALAQSQPGDDASAAITVIGSKPVPDEVRRQAVAFIRDTGVASGETPAARWIDPVCPHVIGVPSLPLRRSIETKLRTIAATAGIKLAREPCRTNIAVVFTNDGAALVRAIAAKDSRRLSQVPMGAQTALKQGGAPIRWWYASEVRGTDGHPATAIAAPWTGGNANGGGSVLPTGEDTTSLQQYGSSMIGTQAVRALTGATVVVDVRLAEGTSLDAVAAYSALVAFAEIRARNPAPAGSILTLFEDGSAVGDLSERDKAFLTALYRLPLDRQAGQQRNRLVHDLIAAELSER